MAEPYQSIRISLNNTDVNKVKNDFNSLVNDLKKKAEQPINLKVNVIGIKDSLKQESKNYVSESSGPNVDKGASDVEDKAVSLGSKMKTIIQEAGTWAFNSAMQKLQEGVDFVNSLDKSQTNIQTITGYSRDQVQGLTEDYAKLADQLYTTTDSMMNGAEEFLRSGNTIEETQSLLKATTIGGAISGQSSQEMAEQLIAISNGFKMTTEDATQMTHVIDTLSTLDTNSATSMKEISTALMGTASSAEMAGISFEDLSSYIATVSSTTRSSAESIGGSFNIGGLVA